MLSGGGIDQRRIATVVEMGGGGCIGRIITYIGSTEQASNASVRA